MTVKETTYVLPLSPHVVHIVNRTIETVARTTPPPEAEFANVKFLMNEWVQAYLSYSHFRGDVKELLPPLMWDYVYRQYEGIFDADGTTDDSDGVAELADFIQAVTFECFHEIYTEIQQLANYILAQKTDIEIVDTPHRHLLIAVGYPECSTP